MNNNISKYFKPENASKVLEDKLSPDEKYRLVITQYATKKDCWNFTQGLIYKIGKDQPLFEIQRPLFEIQRNYSRFPYTWIDHPNSHQYLICGEDYQGQTVLELDTSERLDFLPPEAKDGVGFCWAVTRFDTTSKILMVCGCVWACPYEFRFYDFSSPMDGWPEIEADTYVDEDSKWPTFEPNGTVKTYCTQYEDDEDKPIKPEIRSTKTFMREGLKLKLLNEEVSEEEKIRRKKQADYQQAYEAKMKIFQDTDPLFLCCDNLVKDPVLSPEDHYGIGVTHEGWCPHFKLEEKMFCRRIVNSKKITIDLEWAIDTGPIKLRIYKNGKFIQDKWFDHSVDGMYQAFSTVKKILKKKLTSPITKKNQ
jgi:hypothetical protein